MKSIFQALDGGHLDRALFSSSKKVKDGGEIAEGQKDTARRSNLGRSLSLRVGDPELPKREKRDPSG